MDNPTEAIIKQFRYYKTLGDKAMAQLDNAQLFWQYNEESNSIAIIVNHLAGNMCSRFSDFLCSDGEKPWRNRDQEFVNPFRNRDELLQRWEEGWNCLLNTLASLRQDDMERIVYIRNEGHTVWEALLRQLAHYPYHVGQMVFLAKMLKNRHWQTLSIARNRSAEYNAQKFAQEKQRRHFTDASDQ